VQRILIENQKLNKVWRERVWDRP